MKILSITVLIFTKFIFCSFVSCHLINLNLKIKSADRTIDLRSQITKITNKITIENSGNQPVNHFLFAIEPNQRNKLSYLTAVLREHSRRELIAKEVQVLELPSNFTDSLFYSIRLKESLQPQRTIAIEVDVILTHELLPHPEKISQKEKQLVKYIGNLYLFTPYFVAKQTTSVILPSKSIESYSKSRPVIQSDSGITYGPYEKKASFSQEELVVHFENNNKFLTVTKLERVIEISHWGNIAVEETVNLLHTGALLTGSFSRYEYARESKNGQSSIASFDTILPAAASTIYYRDEIGNISTSHTRVKKDSVELTLRPRFPLFGGWKTKYMIGYNVPSYEYLHSSKDNYILDMRLIDHIYDDMVVDEMLVKIILPEGSNNFLLQLPFESSRLSDSLHYTYLDTVGRPVISITKNNLVENHIQNFLLKYTFPKILMLREPLLVSVVLYLMFILVIIYVRIDFSIDKDKILENKLRVAGQCERILGVQDKRVSTYVELDEQLKSLRLHKEVATYLAAVKNINQDYKNLTAYISELALNLKGEFGEIYDRIQDLQKHDKCLRELYNQQQSLYIEKLVPGKITRQTFIEAESLISKKKEEYIDKINSIIKSLQ